MSQAKKKTEAYTLLGGMNSKASPYNQALTEFRELTNFDFIIPNAITKRPGTTLFVGATVAGRIGGGFEFERLSGASYLVVTANTNAYTATGVGYVAFRSGLLNNGIFDFVPFVDRLFMANGQDFFKFDGTNSSNFSLPPGNVSATAAAAVGGGLSGVYTVAFGYLNDRGYYGPTGGETTISLNGITFGSIVISAVTTPAGYGISAIVPYRTSAGGVDLFAISTMFSAGTATLLIDSSSSLLTRLASDALFFTLVPRYIEIYNNQLFMAGFSSALSTLYWSDIAEPESVDPTFFAEVRTNDGDRITGFRSYNGALIITKERSFHRLTGDNPNNFALQEITDQYGCLSNRAMALYENKLVFLDTKGIVEYNGANIEVTSLPMEPIFQSMNINAARDNAVAIHNRDYNEIWFGIPCNGATFNNCTVVFDYVVKAWTKYEGFSPSSLWITRATLDKKAIFYGGYTGNVFCFGASLAADFNAGITCNFKTVYHADSGQTRETMFRRLYLNINTVTGITQPIDVNLRQDFGASIQISRTMYQNPFQSRIDFGIPARSLSADVTHASSSLSITVFGYGWDTRFLRNV